MLMKLTPEERKLQKVSAATEQLVEHLSHDPKVEGLNPATGYGREKTAKSISRAWPAVVAQMLEQLTLDLKI